MEKIITLHIVEPQIGEFDRHYVDESGNKIAALLRNANGCGYIALFYVDIPDYEPINVGSIMSGGATIKEVLNKNGYTITNKYLP